MKLKKVLCIAALSAAVALTGMPQSTTALVYAEETQIAGLDEILRQMYDLYQNEDYATMVALDISAGGYSETIKNGGSDRYVANLDGNTKAMMYVTTDGGYWWYFGQMENNLRQGHGTAIAFNSEEDCETFTGNYIADSPNGNGTYSHYWYSGEYSGERYDISGDFQGAYLNGTYQVNINWFDYHDGTPCSVIQPITYENNHIKSVGTDTLKYPTDSTHIGDDGNYYSDYVLVFANSLLEQDLGVQIGYEPFVIGFTDDKYHYTHFDASTEYLNAGLPILRGNSDVFAITPAPSETQTSDVQTQTPETIIPTPTAAPAANIYVVERGDNLSKIAQKVYGDQKLWRKIYEANSNVIKSDYIIWTNQVLTIPAL